jgi:hypothetical protein
MRSCSRPREALAVAVLTLLAGCGGSTKPIEQGRHPPTPEEWDHARQGLADLRATAPSAPYVARVHVALREPRTGRTIDARGAVAVDPHRALRMILVGPGGATALDVWVTRARWRLAIPALERVEKGDGEDPAGMPIGFFRWWFLAPLDGALESAEVEPAGFMLVLRDDRATTSLHTARAGDALHLDVSRRARETGATEALDWGGRSLTPHAGDRAAYSDLRTGLTVSVVVEDVQGAPPDPEAFADPGVGGGS